jgi:dTDP-4-amino-4,6-dideoxy-D-galactose acyltransferase
MSPEFWQPLHFLKRYLDAEFQEKENEAISQNFNTGFVLSRLEWDSGFFGTDIYKIMYWDPRLAEKPDFPSIKKGQIFAEVPSEAAELFPVLQKHGFALIETRLTYFHLLENLPAEKQKSRFAATNDITFLKKVASKAVNPYDRYHTDPFFSEKETDRYLETYIENCVKGFAEKVFVPDLTDAPASFVALSRIKDPVIAGGSLFRIPLTACLSQNKGWHYHLCLSALHYAKAQKGKCLVMTTQSTNGAVIHNCEKLGFKLGSVFHIFSKSYS